MHDAARTAVQSITLASFPTLQEINSFIITNNPAAGFYPFPLSHDLHFFPRYRVAFFHEVTASYRRLAPPRYSMIRGLASDRRRETVEVKEEEEKDVWEKRDAKDTSLPLFGAAI